MASPAPEPRPFTAGEGLAIQGEVVGEGPAVLLCHGLTATRRSVVHGSRALERAGHTVVSFDARGHGESDPAPSGQGYEYPVLVADLESVAATSVAGGRSVLAGHSMGAHTALAFALRNPDRVAGVVAIGPTYTAPLEEQGIAYWDGLSEALQSGGVDGFVDYIDRHQETDARWRDSVLRFTRERMLAHRDLDAIARALREVPRSQPFEGPVALEALDLPVLVVASHDEADPGHPYAVAAAYAESLPQGRLASEEEGQSPLAWQGGRLSRAIASFCAEPTVASRLAGA